MGQTIATIDRREIDAQADAAVAAVSVGKAALETAEASLANAVLEHDRAKNLFDKGALPRQRLDGAQTAASLGRRPARPGRRQPGPGRGRAAPRARSAAQRHHHLAGHRLRGRAQLRRRRHSRRPAGGGRRRHAADEARSRRLGTRSRPHARRPQGARRRCRPSPARPSRDSWRPSRPEVDERNRHFKIDVRVPNANRALLSGMYATARIVESTVANAVAACRRKRS